MDFFPAFWHNEGEMKTRFRKEKDIFFIDIEGSLNLRGADSLRAFCAQNLAQKKIVFNLKSLFFVGSSGIMVFSKTLESLGKNNDLKICGASPEFQKIFQSEGLDLIFCQSEGEAISSFRRPKAPAAGSPAGIPAEPLAEACPRQPEVAAAEQREAPSDQAASEQAPHQEIPGKDCLRENNI